jgi:hypothetical protein
MWRLPVLHSIDPDHSARILQLLANQASKPHQHSLPRSVGPKAEAPGFPAPLCAPRLARRRSRIDIPRLIDRIYHIIDSIDLNAKSKVCFC